MTNRFTEIERILSAISDGNAPETGVRHLNELLRDDPEARRFYMAWMDMETNLGDSAVGTATEPMPVPAEFTGLKITSRSYWVRTITAIAASILVLAGAWVGVQYQRSIAVLTAVSGEVMLRYDLRTIQAVTGMQLFSDVEILTRGNQSSAMIAWKDGSSIRMPGESKMTLTEKAGQKQIVLLEGYFEAEFKKQRVGRPALVSGPYMNAEILGTTIRMDAKPDKTKLAVVEGSVRVKRMSDGRSVQVMSRHDVSAGNGTGDFDQQRFYWADRFSGGAAGTSAMVQLLQCEEYKRNLEARFKSAGGSGYGSTSISKQNND